MYEPGIVHRWSSASPPPRASAPSNRNDTRFRPLSADYPLYDPRFEHDACGTGFVANISGQPDHAVVERALEALRNLAHRGAMDAHAEVSDGVGVLTQLPMPLLNRWLTEHGHPPLTQGELAVGMLFLPADERDAEQSRRLLTDALEQWRARVLGWRAVPVHEAVLGSAARTTCPRIEQALVEQPGGMEGDTFERLLYLARKETEQHLSRIGCDTTYIASLSTRTLVYKGLLTAETLPDFYPDLRDPDFTTALAVFHQRYSTNTFPSWRLAQPMRMLAHNGEINTVQGNRNWMAARQATFAASEWGEDAARLSPVIEPEGSDSTSLDNALELLVRSGRALPHALSLLVPEAWERRDDLPPAVRAFYEAQAPLVEPWDGPAALVFSDGVRVGAALDRNGLRPLRYQVTDDGLLVLASETGVIALDEACVLAKGRLGPGHVLLLDTSDGTLRFDAELKATLAAEHPYAEWVERHIVDVPALHAPEDEATTDEEAPVNLIARQTLFGYSHEDVELVLRPMVAEHVEAVWSMGDDTPLAVFSRQPRPLASYFRQRFAQVTNPPIDALREQSVMSLSTYLGARPPLLRDSEPSETLLRLSSPVLDEGMLRSVLATAAEQSLPVTRLSMAYAPSDEILSEQDGTALASALEILATYAVDAVGAGTRVLVLDDRGVGSCQAPIPALLAVAAVHAALVRAGLRTWVGIVVVTGGVWEVHGLATLLGYGANAVCPYLALATARTLGGTRGLEQVTATSAAENVRSALEKGLLKVVARMGLSVIDSYIGAQLFECVGVSPELVERYFPGTPASLGGLTLVDIDGQARQLRDDADRLAAPLAQNGDSVPDAQATGESSEASAAHTVVALRPRLADRGYVRFRRNAEYHATNPTVVKALQQAARSGSREDYKCYTELVYARPPTAIRDLLILRPQQPVPLEDVEPAERIVRRFISTAMSLGSLSAEAHLTLTLAMNSLGGRSNTGEGGEDPAAFRATREGVSTNSRIKQVASGRFGVTAAYLAHADELEIKMAQGSKPGEGGQLPARKVTGLIARLRHTRPGIALISPPPHHDIYSIEDLAQLIYDLKQVNPRAAVGVKLVAERGVGAIAAGVAKAHADYVLISGHDGGTGASPLSSIKHAGIPWEVGLAEAQQVLRKNGLRGRVRLRTDGGLKTGRDIIVAALLGADEFGIGTAALVALGCDMARQCHLDTCPTGIATQREDLRGRFEGRLEHLAAFLLSITEEVRELLASLGARTLDDITGRADLLAVRDDPQANHERATRVLDSLSPLLSAGPDDTPRRWLGGSATAPATNGLSEYEATLLDDALPLLARGGTVLLQHAIRNRDRTVGARLSGEIAHRWGDSGLPEGHIICHYTGSAGQSFGAFCVPGLRLVLVGDANDYVAKGMTGGEIVVMPPHGARFVAHDQTIMGNTVLYGATGGLLLARGRAGERFAVRNSGAIAVVEGVGDHGCEYMTGGVVVVLGETGRNFAAGMSGGIAYVYDEHDTLPGKVNPELVRMERIAGGGEAEAVAALVAYHLQATASNRAAALLANWPATLDRMWRIVPRAAEEIREPLDAVITYLNTRPALITTQVRRVGVG